MDKWITNATKLEKEMFEMAPDKAAYYHMLTQRIYKIQKEIEEKKNRGLRLNEQLKIAFGLPQQHDRSSSNTVQEQKTK
jgi:E1A/CREB-binding protein